MDKIVSSKKFKRVAALILAAVTVTLMKLGEKNGKEKLEYACERMLELSSVPSIRTIAVILKNGKEPERKTTSPADSGKYGITCGAAYFKKGGDRNA